MSNYLYFTKYKNKYLSIGGNELNIEETTDDYGVLAKAYKQAYKEGKQYYGGETAKEKADKVKAAKVKADKAKAAKAVKDTKAAKGTPAPAARGTPAPAARGTPAPAARGTPAPAATTAKATTDKPILLKEVFTSAKNKAALKQALDAFPNSAKSNTTIKPIFDTIKDIFEKDKMSEKVSVQDFNDISKYFDAVQEKVILAESEISSTRTAAKKEAEGLELVELKTFAVAVTKAAEACKMCSNTQITKKKAVEDILKAVRELNGNKTDTRDIEKEIKFS